MIELKLTPAGKPAGEFFDILLFSKAVPGGFPVSIGCTGIGIHGLNGLRIDIDIVCLYIVHILVLHPYPGYEGVCALTRRYGFGVVVIAVGHRRNKVPGVRLPDVYPVRRE